MFKENIIPNKQESEDNKMKNTTEFRNALEKGNLEEAEKFLIEVAAKPDKFPQYDDRWPDHRQRELFQAFYKTKDWPGAKRVIEATKDPGSQEGRISRLEELSGLKFDEI